MVQQVKRGFLPDPAKLRVRKDKLKRFYYYLLGVIGWGVVIYNAPFGWAPPSYAAF